ncbi:MAG: hypothetical protein DRN95_06895 [Candidatus Hydrothermarchaeota archaeon]|nr:MAG: hypothetical protein DRN95_06895 [Candidatus Hydrothermarchaeota archaeon]
MIVLGVDILSGSINSKTEPKYSIAIFNGEKFIHRSEVTRFRLINLIKEIKPDMIACDNVFELFTKKNMWDFFSILPEKTKLIQVNGNLNEHEPLHVVARKNGIKISSKASSMEEAEACALLASKNVGYVVSPFEGGYYIIVSRARSLGRGGQSQDRYRRKVHNMVALTVKEIEEKLKERGISYKLRAVKADSGLARGSFSVNCSREKLVGIKKKKGPDVQVKILPKQKKKLSFTPLSRKGKIVIAGIDPGTTTAIAILDIRGRLLEVTSSKELSLSNALTFLMKYKRVLIVASDVTPAPKFIEKISSSLNSILYTPPEPLSIAEKVSLVNERFSKEVYSNAHERDAIAAAIKAYRKYKDSINEINKKIDDLKLHSRRDEVLLRVLKGEIIENIIHRKEEKKEKKDKKKKKIEKKPDKYKLIIKSLKEEIELLKKEREELIKKIEERDRKIEELERRIEEIKEEVYAKIKKEKEIKIRDEKIKNLSKKLIEEKTLREKIQEKLNELRRQKIIEFSDRLNIVRILPKFTRDEVNKLKKEFREGEIIYIEDSHGGGKSIAEELLSLKPKAIIADMEQMSHLARETLSNAIVIPTDRVNIRKIDNFAVIEKESLEKEIQRIEEEKLEEIILEYRTKRKERFSSGDLL